MKGSVFVLLGCCALFFAAPSHSYSVEFISEDDQLASRQDTLSGSPSTDGGTDPGNGSVPGDAQAGKSKVRKRDTRSLVRDMMVGMDEMASKPVDKDLALYLFRLVGEYGGKCFDQVLNYIRENESPITFGASRADTAAFPRSEMIKWLDIMQDSMSECLRNTLNQLSVELPYDDDDTPNSVRPRSESDAFTVSEFFSWLTDIGRTLRKCLTGAITFLEATSHGQGDAVQRSSESFSDLLEELVQILVHIEDGGFAGPDSAQILPPSPAGPPYPDSVPVITTYKKRNSADKPSGYRHYSNLPGFSFQYAPHVVYNKDIPYPSVPQFSGFRGEAVQLPYTPGITTLPEDVTALPKDQFSLLNIVLDKIYSQLQGAAPPAVNMDAAPAEGLRVDAAGASGLYPSNGDSLAMGNPDLSNWVQECVRRRVQ